MSWTIKTLKKYFELKFKNISKALKLARKQLERRLDGMNEVRAQLDRQVKTFVSVEKFEGEVGKINQKIDALSKLVYIGLGIWLILQPILLFIMSLIINK